MEKVPNPEPEREPDDIRHFADLASTHTACGLERATVRWTDDPATPIECPPCARTLPLVAPCNDDWHFTIPSSGPCPTCGPRAMPAVDSWAAPTDAELGQRLRASADKQLAGLGAATPDAEVLAGMLTPEPVHYDPDIMIRHSPCGLDLNELARERVTTYPAAVTCPACASCLVDSQLPPEPARAEVPPYADVERVEIGADGCGCPITGEMVSVGGELRGDVPGTERTEHRPGCRVAPAVEPQPEHRTVGLELITDELRGAHGLFGGTVGIVCRVNDEVADVPEIDTLWAAAYRKPADILSILLRQARMYADGQAGAELLMPGPEVLAALAGEPVGSYTRSVPSSYGVVEPGWFVLVETVVQGKGDVVWLLVEDRRECDIWRDCAVAGGEPHMCHVVYVRGRGVQHVESWRPVHVRIPATTEVELP